MNRKAPAHRPSERGFVSLLAIIMVITVVVAVGVTWSTTSISELQHGYYENRAQIASARAESCLEDAFMRLKRDNAYAGGTFSLATGTCSVVVSGAGTEKLVEASSTEDTFVQKAGARVDVSGRDMTLVEWLSYGGF